MNERRAVRRDDHDSPRLWTFREVCSSVVLMVIFVLPAPPVEAQVFAPDGQRYFVTLDAPMSTAFGDVNGDGEIDLLTGTWNRVDIRLGIGDGQFGPPTVLPTDGTPLALLLSDFDGDGDLDLVTARMDTRIWLNDGSGGFTETGQVLSTGQMNELLLRDFDGDGNADFAALTAFGSLQIYLGDGFGGFSLASTTSFVVPAAHMAIDDLDGDGIEDVFVGSIFDPIGEVRLGVGGGQFATIGLIVDLGGDALRIADLNSDGFPDLVGIGAMTRIAWGLGDGTFDSGIVEILVGPTVASGDVGDLDQDGSPDLVIGTYFDNTVSVRLNDGTGQFETIDQTVSTDDGSFLTPSLQVTYDVGLYDVDQDGDLDLTGIHSWGFGADYVFVFMNSARGFRRGDSNADGTINLADPIYVIEWLFYGGPALVCEDAGDMNDDGNLNIADAVYGLSYLFTSGPSFAAPFGVCGSDPTLDALPPCTAPCP